MLDTNTILAYGKEILAQEGQALLTFSQTLPADFAQAVHVLFHSKGRVAVTGMGKSGHIARKIAATLSSTGTPAYFVHPGEASHGDLGQVGKEDAIIALSNSGQSAELGDILQFGSRYNLPIIAMTKNPESFLGKQSSICLTLPELPEACPLGCAPTTSTTMMIALGDALALALLRMRGFTAEDFSHFHPGGQLGRKLRLVGDIMHTGAEIPAVETGTNMAQALVEISAKGFGCVAVTKNSLLVGVIADGDLRRHMSPQLLEKNVEDIMTANPATISSEALAAKALGTMNSKGITSLMVVDAQRRILGVVHMHDCLRAGIE